MSICPGNGGEHIPLGRVGSQAVINRISELKLKIHTFRQIRLLSLLKYVAGDKFRTS